MHCMSCMQCQDHLDWHRRSCAAVAHQSCWPEQTGGGKRRGPPWKGGKCLAAGRPSASVMPCPPVLVERHGTHAARRAPVTHTAWTHLLFLSHTQTDHCQGPVPQTDWINLLFLSHTHTHTAVRVRMGQYFWALLDATMAVLLDPNCVR